MPRTAAAMYMLMMRTGDMEMMGSSIEAGKDAEETDDAVSHDCVVQEVKGLVLDYCLFIKNKHEINFRPCLFKQNLLQPRPQLIVSKMLLQI